VILLPLGYVMVVLAFNIYSAQVLYIKSLFSIHNSARSGHEAVMTRRTTVSRAWHVR
jgi:hypothetical protein